MPTTESAGTAPDAQAATAAPATPDQLRNFAYLEALIDDSEEAVGVIERLIVGARQTLADRKADVKRLRAELKVAAEALGKDR